MNKVLILLLITLICMNTRFSVERLVSTDYGTILPHTPIRDFKTDHTIGYNVDYHPEGPGSRWDYTGDWSFNKKMKDDRILRNFSPT